MTDDLDKRTFAEKKADTKTAAEKQRQKRMDEIRRSKLYAGTGAEFWPRLPVRPKSNKCWPTVGMIIRIKGFDAEWKVVETEWCGGGTGHGLHDVYPDGYQVRCMKHPIAGVDDYIKFYRRDTGCFISSVTVDPADIEEVK